MRLLSAISALAILSLCTTTELSSSEQTDSSDESFFRALLNDSSSVKERVKRVVGGFVSPPEESTYMASVRYWNAETRRLAHHCGATLIYRRFLVTAAHCFDDDRNPRNYDVVVGDWRQNLDEGWEQEMSILAIHKYPCYEGEPLYFHDIAVIELHHPVELNDYVTELTLPPKDFSHYATRQCTVMGWGSTENLESPRLLRAGLVRIMDRETCQGFSDNYQFMHRRQFCAGYYGGRVDTCQGDSGGPLVCHDTSDGVDYFVGVTSWGLGCGEENSPGVYTTVASYLDWIDKTVKKNQRSYRNRA